MKAREAFGELLAAAGAQIDGPNPWDPQIHNERFYSRVLREGSLGLGESYMDGWWDCERIDELAYRIFWEHVDARPRVSLRARVAALRSRLLNLQSRSRALPSGGMPYEFGEDLFRKMLDRRRVYSCAYWRRASTLEQAQEHKLDLVCRKLSLKPGDRVLDVGCGWGSFARFAAERYGVSVAGINLSHAQVAAATEECRGLPVEIRFQDYRDLPASRDFDHVVSIGMFEHVGYKNYRAFLQIVRGCLKPGGLFLLQTIGRNRSATRADLWVQRYIFPNAMLPSARQLSGAIEGFFVIEDWANFSTDYDRTLMEWFARFERSWPELCAHYDERFRRMWTFYLLGSAARFRARRNQLWQLVLSERGVPGGYSAIR